MTNDLKCDLDTMNIFPTRNLLMGHPSLMTGYIYIYIYSTNTLYTHNFILELPKRQ